MRVEDRVPVMSGKGCTVRYGWASDVNSLFLLVTGTLERELVTFLHFNSTRYNGSLLVEELVD